MEKKILITISDNIEHLYGVQFFSVFLTPLLGCSVTLLHVSRSSSGEDKNAEFASWEGGQQDLPDVVNPQTQKAIDKSKDILKCSNTSFDKIVTKTVSERYGKVKDILLESERGMYDAIILGRRASYALQWLFEKDSNETILEILQESNCNTPLWICPDPENMKKNILVCIDGTENSYRAVDHVGFMFSAHTGHKITLFNAENTVGTENIEYFKKAQKILLDHNVAPSRIQSKVTWGLSPGATILKEADTGKYGAVAVGMGGYKRGGKTRGFAGKVTLKLINRLEGFSLICCP